MSTTQQNLRLCDYPNVILKAEVTTSIGYGKNGAVIYCEARIKTDPQSIKYFSSLSFAQVVTFIMDDGSISELFYAGGTSQEYLFTTHPNG